MITRRRRAGMRSCSGLEVGDCFSVLGHLLKELDVSLEALSDARFNELVDLLANFEPGLRFDDWPFRLVDEDGGESSEVGASGSLSRTRMDLRIRLRRFGDIALVLMVDEVGYDERGYDYLLIIFIFYSFYF